MYDPTVNAQTLARQLRDPDFIADPQLLNAQYRRAFLQNAALVGNQGFPSLALISNKLRGKPVYGITDLAQLLILRLITTNIRRVTGVKQDDRRFIVECIMSLLAEGVRFRMYKFDVESFYESVQPSALCSAFENDVAFSGQSANLLRSFFLELDKAGVLGLPRGLSISATMAEYLMRDFDEFVSATHGVLYYSRFVDDICIITDASEDKGEFTKLVSDRLPPGLVFNTKSKPYTFAEYDKNVGNILEHCIDYLGYALHVSYSHRGTTDDLIRRDVWSDISLKKVNKIKTRVTSSLLRYRQDSNFQDLRDRIRILTGNFSLQDRNTGVKRVAGIRFNYALVDAQRSTRLPELDRFLRNALMSTHAKNRVRPNLSLVQRRDLVRYTFSNGFRKKVFYHFSPARLAKLTECWSYV